ncbi:hypothetical protein QCB45_06100 [Thiomicrorhabdus sp. ZW0627]|uniref:hypothetical protein n=1 Tax=Thiomicrorhabdus sp. ZW0627 TaxID=3039774 RepID=UPI0024364868|nr:hypothetical protein [Thiomicrorhabdus sp. ZW0627]MDG6773897.1 hypothetical protein [Thiomicrorhabdus sp. ZW0627]
MQLLRLILNNGFFILVLAAAAILSLAYSTRAPESNEMKNPLPITDSKTIENNAAKSDRNNELNTSNTTKEESDSSLNDATLVEPLQTTENVNVQPEQDKIAASASKTESAKEDTQSQIKPNVSSMATENKYISLETEIGLSSENESNTRSNREVIESTLIQYNSFQQAWQAARFAFYNSNLSQAEQIYDALAIISQNPNVLGEYGNLMWRLNQPQKAAQLWKASANEWISNNQSQRAAYLANRLATFSPQTTDWIRKRLNQTQMDNVMNLLPRPPVHSIFPRSNPSNTAN